MSLFLDFFLLHQDIGVGPSSFSPDRSAVMSPLTNENDAACLISTLIKGLTKNLVYILSVYKRCRYSGTLAE